MEQHFQAFISAYGYIAIFILLFCGIVGIPAPEESMMVFVGIAIAQGSLKFGPALMAAFSGSVTGMIAAYVIGYLLGNPVLYKLGKFIGISQKKWDKAITTFKKHALWSIAVGFFIPGIRQINPYMAGISRTKIHFYLPSALLGALTWTTSFLLIGFFVGDRLEKFFTLTPVHIAIGLTLLLFVFALFIAIQVILFRRQTE
ncbi:MAG: DedA family protein [Tuberibacillus sp.]